MDQDATQIINLILCLGESRRRQANSSIAFTLGAGHLAQLPPPRTNNSSPFPERVTASKRDSPRLQDRRGRASWTASERTRSPAIPIWEFDTLYRAVLAPSDVTKTRVARAKPYFDHHFCTTKFFRNYTLSRLALDLGLQKMAHRRRRARPPLQSYRKGPSRRGLVA